MIAYPPTPPVNLVAENPTGNEAFTAQSNSTTHHTVSIKDNATSGANSSALNLVSENNASSCLQVTGCESARGTIKVSHINKTGTVNGDKNAAVLSLEVLNGEEGGSEVQGIAIKPGAAGWTGPFQTFRDGAGNLMSRVRSTGALEQRVQASDPTVEAGCFCLYVKAEKLFVKLGAEAAKEIAIP